MLYLKKDVQYDWIIFLALKSYKYCEYILMLKIFSEKYAQNPKYLIQKLIINNLRIELK